MKDHAIYFDKDLCKNSALRSTNALAMPKKSKGGNMLISWHREGLECATGKSLLQPQMCPRRS